MNQRIPRSRTRLSLTAVALVALGALTACAEDSAADTVTTDSVTSDSVVDGPRECEPVNTELEREATSTIDITLTDYAFDRTEYRAEAGVITFHAVNEGGDNHEIAFLPAGGDVPHVDGRPDEDALAEVGAFELEAFGPNRSCNATYELAAGTYTLFCIVDIDDEHTHYDEGMRATLIVT